MSTTIDVGTLDLIENALLNARFEMDEVVRRAAMSPMIRVQHDEFPMICNARGQMVVGQFGSYIPEVIDRFGGDIVEGDVILLNDPYLCKGSISHCNDWLVILPVFFEGRRVAFTSLFGHMMDVGGKVPGSQVSDALSIWEEGIRIPPIKIVDRGVLNETALDVILNNTRTPDTNRSDLMALIGGCRAARQCDVEHRTLPDGALDPQTAAVQLDELARKGQAESRALLLVGVVATNLAEFLEDGLVIFGRDSNSGVVHRDDHVAVFASRANVDPSAVGREFHGVGEQIEQDLL